MPMTKPIRALDPTRVAVIREVYKAAQALDFEIFMIGATARIILLEHVFGLSAGRTSNDIDFALAIENWTMYEKIKAYLINECGFTQSNGKIHQLFFNTDISGGHLMVSGVVSIAPKGIKSISYACCCSAVLKKSW